MMVEDDARAAALEAVLERAVTQIEDLTAPAMELYYQRFPEALASFEYHGMGNRKDLEGEMVANSIFFFMTWVTNGPEVRLALQQSVPHHRDTLQVPPAWYRGLLDCVIDVIVSTVPTTLGHEISVVESIRTDLHKIVDDAALMR